jgi:hypothetical protein
MNEMSLSRMLCHLPALDLPARPPSLPTSSLPLRSLDPSVDPSIHSKEERESLRERAFLPGSEEAREDRSGDGGEVLNTKLAFAADVFTKRAHQTLL